jgi:hypothetical protein
MPYGRLFSGVSACHCRRVDRWPATPRLRRVGGEVGLLLRRAPQPEPQLDPAQATRGWPPRHPWNAADVHLQARAAWLTAMGPSATPSRSADAKRQRAGGPGSGRPCDLAELAEGWECARLDRSDQGGGGVSGGAAMPEREQVLWPTTGGGDFGGGLRLGAGGRGGNEQAGRSLAVLQVAVMAEPTGTPLPDALGEQTKLAFEATRDSTKQVLTLAAAIVAVTVTFAKDIVVKATPAGPAGAHRADTTPSRRQEGKGEETEKNC